VILSVVAVIPIDDTSRDFVERPPGYARLEFRGRTVRALLGVSGLPYAHGMTVPFSEARALAEDARARALALGKALSIAVVDYGGFIVLIERMDGARPMTADIALAKAYSAAVMQRPTEMLENWRNADPVFFTQVGRMGHRPIVATKGGVTIKRDGAILGGLGVSGGSPDEDQRVCEDVLKAAGFELDFPQWAGARKG
jgi:uncharacterized protein GlcG (DUF336 family)